MLTVLIRHKKSRREILIPARTVEFVPRPEEGSSDSDSESGLLINHAVEAEGGCHLGFSESGDPVWRDVFVMNGQGQTVARYTL